jgi:hypothetical protein
MRKIQESDFPIILPRNVYWFIAISGVFAFLSLAANLLVLSVSYGNQNYKHEIFLILGPLICSLLGIMFGYLAKEIIRNHLAVSKSGCIVDALIYMNFITLGVFFVFLCGMIYIAPLSD